MYSSAVSYSGKEHLRTLMVSAPAIEPVSLQEMRQQARILNQDSDAALNQIIPVARRYVERYVGRALIEQGYQGYCSRFYTVMRIPHPPLIAVSAVKYTDPDGVVQTVDPAVYSVDAVSQPGHIYLATNQSWPETICNDPNAVKISYTAGYGPDPQDVPQNIRQAIIVLGVTLFDNPSITGQRDSSEAVGKLLKNLLSVDRNLLA